MSLALLLPVRIKVSKPHNGKPSYSWVDGYQVITPNGASELPYLSKREALAYCKAQGWASRVLDPNAPRYYCYLSNSGGMWRVIVGGLPICADKATRDEAIQASRKLQVALAPAYWQGDKGQWFRLAP